MLAQTRLRQFLTAKSLPLGGLLPAGAGQGVPLPTLTLAAIGRKHNATAAQVALKWPSRSGRCSGDPEGVSRRESQQANLDALQGETG